MAIYTSYLAKLPKLDPNIKKIFIFRFGEYPNKENHILLRELAPSKNLLLTYKNNNDWNYYKGQYNDQLNNNLGSLNELELLAGIAKNEDVVLICFEKDYNYCHRKLLAEHVSYRWKIEYLGEI